jgi:hypothetical protein
MEADFECQPQLDPKYSISFSLLLEPSDFDMRTVNEHRLLDRHEVASRLIRQDTR